jgi:hypothetical protein
MDEGDPLSCAVKKVEDEPPERTRELAAERSS